MRFYSVEDGEISPKFGGGSSCNSRDLWRENMVFVYIVQMPLWRHFCALWILAMGMKLLSLRMAMQWIPWQFPVLEQSLFFAILIMIDVHSVESVKESITEKTKAVIVNSYAGDCGDLDELSGFARITICI